MNASTRGTAWPLARSKAPWAMSTVSEAKTRMRDCMAMVVST
ncbi:hypothetical protein ACFZBE_27410 [Streptomyces sp. NPDC008061]